MKKRILLIEDNLEMRENTAEILELDGYEVLTAQNGRAGVETARKEHPDLIICDIMMPELDGYGVLHMLSRSTDTSSIPFIFLSAKAEKSDVRKGMNLGADDYLTKPFEETDLLEAVESRLKRSEAFKQEFDNSLEGFDAFVSEAKGLEELKQLSADRKVKSFKKKDIIYWEGDRANGLFFVKSGQVKTYRMNDDGKELVTGIYKSGDFFGYHPLIENKNYEQFAAAMEGSELCIIPREDFIELLFRNQDVANRFIKMLSNNLSGKEEELLSLAYGTVRKRVADALLMLREKEGGADEIAISRYDLAGMVGTAVESVIRTLSDFKDEGLVSIKGRRITLLNADSLGLE